LISFFIGVNQWMTAGVVMAAAGAPGKKMTPTQLSVPIKEAMCREAAG